MLLDHNGIPLPPPLPGITGEFARLDGGGFTVPFEELIFNAPEGALMDWQIVGLAAIAAAAVFFFIKA